MYESQKIAENIKKIAKEKKIQQKELLEKAGLNLNTFTNMKKGSMLKADSLAKIADILKVSVDYLMEREKEEIIEKWNKLDYDEKKIIGQQIDTIIAVKERKQGKLSS